MAFSAVRMGIEVRQSDACVGKRLSDYPGVLPFTHPAALANRRPHLRWKGGVLIRYTSEEFMALSPLAQHCEVIRCHAEARLALSRTDELKLSADDEEWLLQRALGILPGYEDQRYLELATCHQFAPDYMTSTPERFITGIARIEHEYGFATTLGYGSLLLAGVRTSPDLVKYGRRLETIFARVTAQRELAAALEKGGTGLKNLRGRDRVEMLYAALSALWHQPTTRPGAVFLFTQVIDGFLNLRPGGAGTGLGLAIIDAIILAKLGFAVATFMRGDRYYLTITIPGKEPEFWDPLDPDAKATTAAERPLSTTDIFIQAYTHLARGYAAAHAYTHVERLAHWLLKLQPDLNEAFSLLAVAQVGLGRPREAIDYSNRALKSNLNLPDTWLVQGNAYALLSRWPEAIAAYRHAIAHRAEYPEALNNLGLAYDRNGEHDKALATFRHALRLNPEYIEAWYNIGNSLLEHKQFESAVKAYEKAVQYRPQFAGAHYNMGQACYEMGQKHEAIRAYLAAVKANPKHAGAWHNLGIVYRDLGESQRAVEAIERAVALNPTLLR